MSDFSYNPKHCCGSDCYAHGLDDARPCWGEVDVIDEVPDGMDGYFWIHACLGHRETWDGGAYFPLPDDEQLSK